MAIADEILYELSCGHIAKATLPVTTVAVECKTCGHVVTIWDVHVHEWHVRCNKLGCGFSRWTGLSRDLAEWHANQHWRRHTAHRNIDVGYARNPRAEAIRKTLVENGVIKDANVG